MKLDITFDEKTMFTPVYIKIGAQETLLLSEGAGDHPLPSGCGTSGQENEGTEHPGDWFHLGECLLWSGRRWQDSSRTCRRRE